MGGRKIREAKKRDYKAEYKKFQSSTKSKKYRAELNKYNRQKGTYGNGDGKDASHKGGKIAGFEKESVNRGRREKSRLKKEGKLTESMYAKLGSKVEKFVKQYHGKNKFVSLPSWKVTMTYPKQPGRTHNQWVNAKSAKDAIKISKMMWKNQDIKVANAVFDDETWLKIQKAQKTGFTEGKLTESQQVAKTILQQLGGNRFIAMTGAKNFGSSKNSLQFKIGRNSKSISHVIITLKSTDLYDVEFIRMRGVNRKVVKKLKGVYADQLGKIFTKFTGLRTRL